MNNIKKNDQIKVICGKDKGKTGKVIMIKDENKVVVENINVGKRHTKRSQTFQGGIVTKPIAFDISNVALVCPSCEKATRIDKSKLVDKRRVRACKKCGEIIDKK